MRGGESRIPPPPGGRGGSTTQGKKIRHETPKFLDQHQKVSVYGFVISLQEAVNSKKKLKKIPKIQAPNCERYTGQRKTPKLGLPWVSTRADDAGPNRVEEGSKGQKRWVSKSGVNVLTIVQWNVLHMCGENWKT